MSKIKVLMVLGNTGRGGAQTFAMNVLRLVDREKIQVDFAVNEIRDNGYTQEIYALGSKIYQIPFFKGYNWLGYVNTWNRLLKENHYDIIHGHVSSSAAIYLKVARKHGCKTIVHSHSAGYRGNKVEQAIKKIFTIGAKGQADYWFACSAPAAVRLYGCDYRKNAHYYDIPNAIIAESYRFNETCRADIRKKHRLDNAQRVYGHVGSFTAPKNHDFLLDVFSVIANSDPKAVLILAGEGERRDDILSKINALGLNEKVLLVGNVGNVNEYLMAMDALIFPSLYEGVPLVLVEAQAAGLYCVVSDSITDEVNLTECIVPVSLKKSAAQWAKIAQEIPKIDREAMNQIVSETKYNMQKSVVTLTALYETMSENRNR